jgi:hypothetical protein
MPSSSHIGNFLLIFAALCIVSLGLVLGAELGGWAWAKTSVTIGQELGRLFFTATAITFILVEGGIVLAELYKKASRAEGRAEGRALEREEWQAWRVQLEKWQQRKDHAKSQGEDFNEPPPTSPSD